MTEKTKRPNRAKRNAEVAAALHDTSLIDRDAFAALLGVTPQSVWRFEKTDPTFPQAVYVGAQPRFLVREVREWIEAQAAKRPSARRAAAATETEVA